MNCKNCGQANDTTDPYCPTCAALLGVAPVGPPPPLNERYEQLADAAQRVAAGEWTAEQFVSFLDLVSAMLTQKEAEVRDLEIPPEAFEDFRQEIEAGFAGIRAYNDGLAVMRLFVEDGETSHLEEGLQIIRDGNDHLNEAMRINHDNQRRLQEILFSGPATI